MKIMNRRIVIVGLLVSGLMGCEKASEDPLCTNHAASHSGHIADVAKVNVVYSDVGAISATVVIPAKFVNGASSFEPDSLLSLKTTKTCRAASPQVNEGDGVVEISLQYDCDADNTLEKAEVLLFEHYQDIQELEVHVNTPAVAKHFVLNRKCDRPIFKFKREQDNNNG